MYKTIALAAVLAALLASVSSSQTLTPGKSKLTIRGEDQNIFYIPPPSDSIRLNCDVIFAPGDGGWRGFAITIADSIASWGYDVYGFDTKRYLSSFTNDSTLKPEEVTRDFAELAAKIDPDNRVPLILAGWSEGAGLGILGAQGDINKKLFIGILTIGLPDSNVLGWRFADNLTYLTKKNPDEPMFASADYLKQISPLPFFMIQSTSDEYVSAEKAKQLFAIAGEPKQFSLIEAKNHHFGDNQEDFFGTLRDGFQWIRKISR